MNSHPEDSSRAPKAPLPATGNPEPCVIAAARPRARKVRWAVLALVLGAGLIGYCGLRMADFGLGGGAPGQPEAVIGNPQSEIRNPKSEMVDLSPLLGGGLTVAEFVALIEKVSAQPVKCEVLQANDPRLKPRASLGTLRFAAYDGDCFLPIGDALAMLRYAGLSVEQSQKDGQINIHPVRSKERVLELLGAGADPDGPEWGALRPWRSFKVSSALGVEALAAAAEAAPELGSISALVWALPGSTHLVSVKDDGRVTQEYSGLPSPVELKAAERLLVKLACFPGAEADPATRAAAVSGLGGILRLDSQAQLQGNSPLVRALGVLLKDQDAEVSRAAVLAAGNSAAVAVLALLVEHLVAQGVGSDRAADLVALTQAESLGRYLDRQALGATDWERRRALFQRVSSWLTTAPVAHLSFDAAWLRAEAVFCPGAAGDSAERTKAVAQRLWQSGNTLAQLVVLSVDQTGERLAAKDLPARLQAAVAAGPLWPRSRFPLSVGAAWLAAGETRLVQAALWRLSRGEQLRPEKALSGAENASLVNALMAFAANNPSPILRRLAVEALFRERQQQNAAGATEKSRLSWDTRPALRSFMDDKNGAVQTAAAGAVGRLADPTELSEIAQPGLRDRAPEAVARLLETLADRLMKSTGQTPELTQAIIALCELCLDFGDEAVEQQAGWLRLTDPEMSLEAKVRLLSSFKKAPARAGGIRALGLSGARADWPIKLVSHLLADNSAHVRAAVFQFRLPERVSPKENGLKLWLQGLRDTESQVRLAALRALGPARQQTEAVLKCLREQAASDPEAEVRAYAAGLLRSTPAKPAGQ